MSTASYARLADQGMAAWRTGDAAAARAAWEQVAAAGNATAQLWVLLAKVRERTGAKADKVDDAVDRALAMEPRNLGALIIKGDRAADDRAACSFYAMALECASVADRAQPGVAKLLDHARIRYDAAAKRFAEHLKGHVSASDAGARFDEAVALVTGEKQLYLQQPNSFFFPGLPHRQFFPSAEFAWADDVARAYREVHGELEALLGDGADALPYVQEDRTRANRGHPLLDDPNWSAFHLIENGTPTAHATRCPKTMALLDTLPLPQIAGRSPMALFSILRPGTHIPPHHGLLNTRLICHLPLIVPEGCRLRVGNDTRTVQPGELIIFDDSIEHEAWNDGNATRIVLLFEIWRPELNANERTALTRLYETIDLYGGG